MVRISKQAERRSRSPKKHRKVPLFTGSLASHLPTGYKPHTNALSGDAAVQAFIPKIR